tara:strand:- start:56 stop:271 length:216 start_codon:yes stop_codon:yes gene_type:complete
MKLTEIVLIATVAVLSISLITKPKINNFEVINTAEDMIEWMIEDVASGYIDSVYADSYIDNLEQIIADLKQ